jgi:hypothetical protein
MAPIRRGSCASTSIEHGRLVVVVTRLDVLTAR